MTHTSRLTRAVRAGIETDTTHGAVVPPIYLSSTFAFEGFDKPRAYDYTRAGNPTRDVLGDALAVLEGGAGGVVAATGTAAMTAVLLSLVPPDATVVIPHDCYGGTWRLFDALQRTGHLRFVMADLTEAGGLDAALTDGLAPRIVWIETPSNPLLRITDIAAVAARAHELGALVVADNTFLTPLCQRPLELGCDLVVHSTTKYLNGHSDVVGGAIVARTAELHEDMTWWANTLGVTGSPFDSYLTVRGLRSLQTRLRQHEHSAAALADTLIDHEAVRCVYYPGLPDHPGRHIAERQQDGFGGIVSVDLAGGREAARAFVQGLRCFSLAESLGGAESLVDHPATMTHLSMPPPQREAAGIGDGLIRLSAGLEDTADLLADVRDAVDRAAAATS